MNWYKRAKTEVDFDFGDEKHTLWRKLLREEQKRLNIQFDEENDDSRDDKTKEINLGIKEDLFKEDEYKVRAQIWSAGGDWESPVVYFRGQLFLGKRALHKFIYIPSKKDGNRNLQKTDKGYNAADSEDYEKITDADEKTLWKAFKDFATDLAKKVEKNGTYKDDENKAYVRDLTDII